VAGPGDSAAAAAAGNTQGDAMDVVTGVSASSGAPRAATTAGGAASSSTSGSRVSAVAAARAAAAPAGWLRAIPPGLGVGSAPPDAYRVGLCTSGKPGSGTKTRVSVEVLWRAPMVF
jgi:hypothetical protein